MTDNGFETGVTQLLRNIDAHKKNRSFEKMKEVSQSTKDAGIEIRRGAMDRSQAINLVRLYDGHYPVEFIETYLEYFQMTMDEFDAVLDKWVNRDLFEKVDGIWQPTFEIE